MNRRDLLKWGGGALAVAGATAVGMSPASAMISPPAAGVRRLSLYNLHTGDTFNDAFWEAGNYVPDALAAVNHVMRDWRSGDVHQIDPHLLDLLVDLHGRIGANAPYQIISGYRSPATNAMLHANSDGVAAHSLHMDGKAIDIRVGGVELSHLRDAALSMQRGGVGYYPTSDFVHVDTGRVRRW